MKKRIIILIIFILLIICFIYNMTTNQISIDYIYENNTIETIKFTYNDNLKEIDHIENYKVFKGYYLDSEYKEKIDISNYKITKPLNIYLKYEEYKNYNVLYVPLDNRPINKNRAILLAKSLNMNLIMPEEDLYRTYLDNQLLNSNNTQIGNPKGILGFIKTLDVKLIDAFVISLDQITSGGLVGSRSNYDSNIDDEINIIEELLKIIGDKPLYLIDTVMRLAPTVDFDGHSIDDYNNIYNYANVERYILSQEKLSVDNVIQNYNIDSQGNEIDYKGYGLSQEQFNNYIVARIRKLKLTQTIMSMIDTKKVYYVCGIDDSSSRYNIQKNEINYLRKAFSDLLIFPGADELGLMCISKAYQDLVNFKNLKCKINVFGDNYSNDTNNYDGLSIEENLKKHLNALDIENKSSDYDFEILLLSDGQSKEEIKEAAIELISKMNQNFKNNTPTCIIDCNAIDSEKCKILPELLLNNKDLSLLIGYSGWNTIGNSIGIALSQASSRLSYLKSDYSLFSSKCDEGFIESLTFSLIKDISYKAFSEKQMANFIDENAKDSEGNIVKSSSNFFQYIPYSPNFTDKLVEYMDDNSNTILSNLKDCHFYSSLRKETIYKKVENIVITNYYFPWHRKFEISFDIEAKVK